MSGRPPKLDSTALDAVLGGALPSGFTIEQRVAMVGEVFQALIEDRKPSRAAALFVAGGGLAWLREGGNLPRDFWKIVLPRSHRTTSRIWAELGAQNSERDAPEDVE